MLCKCEGDTKQECEMSGAKKLFPAMRAELGRFADILVCDAVYLTGPFLQLVADLNIDCVVRLEDERRHIYREAEDYIAVAYGEGGLRPMILLENGKTVSAYEYLDGRIPNYDGPVRIFRFVEFDLHLQQTETFHILAASEMLSAITIWKIMHKRWDI